MRKQIVILRGGSPLKQKDVHCERKTLLLSDYQKEMYFGESAYIPNISNSRACYLVRQQRLSIFLRS